MKIPLIAKLALAAAIGVACGLVLPDAGMRALTTAQALFSQFIKFLVPLIILGFVTPAIADTGKGAGRALLVTMGVASVSTLFAGYLAFGLSAGLFPSLLGGTVAASADAAKTFPVYFTLKIPPVTDVVTALVLAFVIGLGIVATQADAVYRASRQFRAIVEWALGKAFVPLLPIYILTVTAELTAS